MGGRGLCRNFRNRFGVVGARLCWMGHSLSSSSPPSSLSVYVDLCVCTFASIYPSISPLSSPSAPHLSVLPVSSSLSVSMHFVLVLCFLYFFPLSLYISHILECLRSFLSLNAYLHLAASLILTLQAHSQNTSFESSQLAVR